MRSSLGNRERNIVIGLFLSGLIAFGNGDHFYTSGNLDAYARNQNYFENVSRAASPAIVQRTQFEKTAVSPPVRGLQVDDWKPVPAAFNSSRYFLAAKRGNAERRQWAGAISAGFVSAVAALMLMLVSGARFNWF